MTPLFSWVRGCPNGGAGGQRGFRRARTFACVTCAAGAATFVDLGTVRADPPWVSRRLTLYAGEFSVDLGVGIADDARANVVGTGAFARVAYGITDRIELSVRDGVRFGEYGQYARADQYGRLYTTSGETTPATGLVGNPDLVLVGRFLDLGYLELGAEVEAGFPVEPHTSFASTAGLAAVLHLADRMRFDTGAYLTLTFDSPVHATLDFPFELWFQTGRVPLWLGPVAGLTTYGDGGKWTVPLGFAAGYALTRDIDLRAEGLVPEANTSPGFHDLGFGVGGQIRF